MVRANESGSRAEEKNLTEKLPDYLAAGIERIYISLPTPERADRYLQKLADIPKAKSSKIWITDEDSWRKEILGPIWRTPKNYLDGRTYSILKPEV